MVWGMGWNSILIFGGKGFGLDFVLFGAATVPDVRWACQFQSNIWQSRITKGRMVHMGIAIVL